MFRTINDFLEAWKYESEATLKVFNNLTDESLNQKVTPDGRSIKQLTWHITLACVEMLRDAALIEALPEEFSSEPNTVKTFVLKYEKASSLVKEIIVANWSDQNLPEELAIYGDVWKKGSFLFSLIVHQAHHRAQMTVLMRQAGLKVPGVYGPSKEEWTAFGMPVQE